ncbi:bicarbonate transport ATP-binding protein CmpC [Abditibacteriota bacterium]|nr:bicarbonate transport ATP-binding protein CmpC [Abditibacteriota bacterium]
MNPFVQIQGVNKTFKTAKGPYTAVRDINLTVAQGEFIAFIGHSGCGKSTVLNMIAGLYQPTEGKVLVEGREIKGPGSDRAMVFQNYALLPWLSVSENVFQAVDSVYEKTMTGEEKRALALKFVDMVGLSKHRDKLPGQLSGGMKQRCAIARAFATKPDVLLLDEPFGALDALTKGALHDELLEIWNDSANNGRKQTIFMVTHDIDEAIYLCDRIVVFTNGPGATIGEIIEVPIPRPRDKRLISTLSAYSEIKGRLIDLLTVGSLGAQKKAGTRDAKTVRVGFMPLTDCAPLVMAKELELDFKYGIKLELAKDSSWMNVRDKLITGELDAAHCLWSLPMALAAGVAPPSDARLPVAMTMSANGQAIVLSGENFPVSYGDLNGFREAARLLQTRRHGPLTFASTFPGGTHDMWMRATLDAAGLTPDDYKIVTVPPPQMVLNLQMGQIDGFCAGEPWPALAASRNAGWTFLASQDIWPDHPEKALVLSPQFWEERRDNVKALMKALLEACLWLDDPRHLDRAAQRLAAPEYVGTAYEVIKGRLEGVYKLGDGKGERDFSDSKMAFSKGGTLNAPRAEYARWFLSHFAPFGLGTTPEINEDALTAQLILSDLYLEVVQEMNEAGFDLPIPTVKTLEPNLAVQLRSESPLATA